MILEASFKEKGVCSDHVEDISFGDEHRTKEIDLGLDVLARIAEENVGVFGNNGPDLGLGKSTALEQLQN